MNISRRVFAISDLHLDYAVNAQWLHDLSLSDYQHDILILAGDISDSPRLLDMCFQELVRRFHRVLFVPGNHDIWVLRFDKECNSLEKWQRTRQMAGQHGVLLEPWSEGGLTIVPLLSWYDFSFGQPDEQLQQVWMDFHACKWPDGFDQQRITEYFLAHNEAHLDLRNQTVISFSHFMPRIDIMPEQVPKLRRFIYPVLGSSALEKQIRRLQPQIHVYGHSHLNRHLQIDKITYINNAFAYPSETRIAAKKLVCIYQY